MISCSTLRILITFEDVQVYFSHLISPNLRALSSANNFIRVSLLLPSKESVRLYNSKSIFGMNFTVHTKNASKKVE